MKASAAPTLGFSMVQREVRFPKGDRSSVASALVFMSMTKRTLAPGKSLTKRASNSTCWRCTATASCMTKTRAGRTGPCVAIASSTDSGAKISLKR